MDTKELKVRIIADVKNFNNSIKEIEQGMQKATKSISGITKTGEVVKGVGKTLTKSITLPITAIGAASSKLYYDFDNAMRGVAGTMGITAQEIANGSESYKKLEGAARDCGKNTQFSATESAEALNYLALAGYDVDKAIAMLPKTLNLAAAGNLDLASATDMVTDSASALGLDIKGTERLIDQMAKTSQKSNTNIAQLGEGILTVGGTAKFLAGGTTELNTCLGILADNGIKGAEGGTALRNMILSLTAPTDKASKCMKSLGLEVFDAQGKMRPMNDIFKDLNSKLGEMSESERINVLNTLFNKVDLKSANALLANCGDRFDFLSSQIGNADGSARQMADTMNSGMGGALKEMKSALEEAGLSIGEVLAPMLKKIAGFIKNLALGFSNLSPGVKKFIVIAGGLLAALGPVLVIIGSLIGLIASLATVSVALDIAMAPLIGIIAGIVAVIVAVVAIGAALIANWDTIKSKACELGQSIVEAWNNIKQWTSDTWNGIKEYISNAWESIKSKTSEIWSVCCDVISSAWEAIKNVVQVGVMFLGELIQLGFNIITLPWQFIWQNCKDYVIQAWELIKDCIKTALNFVANIITQGWNTISSVTSNIWNNIKSIISNIWNNIKSLASSVFNNIKSVILNIWTSVSSITSSIWNSIRSVLSSIWSSISVLSSSVFNVIKNSISNAWNSISSITSSIWNGVKSTVSNIWNGIVGVVSNGVSRLKSLMHFHWSLPKLKLPHFSISGKFSLNPPSVPHFGISWYSKGGIFKKPTVLGGVGVGDRHNGIGSNMEAVLPINELPKLLGLDKKTENTNDNRPILINIDGRKVFEVMSPYLGRSSRGW